MRGKSKVPLLCNTLARCQCVFVCSLPPNLNVHLHRKNSHPCVSDTQRHQNNRNYQINRLCQERKFQPWRPARRVIISVPAQPGSRRGMHWSVGSNFWTITVSHGAARESGPAAGQLQQRLVVRVIGRNLGGASPQLACCGRACRAAAGARKKKPKGFFFLLKK